jgi:HEAT repeat protein
MSHIITWLSLPFAAIAGSTFTSNPIQSTCAPSQVESLKAHYAAAEQELAMRDVSSLTSEQRERRARLIDALRAYRERGAFGRNVDFPGERMPLFVDGGGRRCAVAELLHATGDDVLVALVHEQNNSAWIVELARDPTFNAWLDRNGLTLEEAARIQAPMGHGGLVRPHQPPAFSSGNTARDGGSGPSASAPASGGSAGSRGDSSGPSSGGPNAGGPPSGGPATGQAPNSLSTSTQQDELDSWAMWWEYNKLEYLKPNQLSAWSFPSTGDQPKAGFERELASMRNSLAPLLVELLDHKDANVRAASAVSLGRIGSPEAVDHLKKLLDDPSVAVRHHAILALGATGTGEAAALLLTIAEHGAVQSGATERISRQAPALAIIALGLVRQQSGDQGIDEAVARIARMHTGEGKNLVEEAAFMYETLSPCAELERFALEIAQQKNGDALARCRAVECLRTTQDRDTLAKLQHILSGTRLDLRRSAALAMGGIQDPLVLPALMTAYELEGEPLTKSFLAISIGKHGGATAREFLLGHLDKGDPTQRRWCALALGILSRKDGDPSIGDSIRAAALRERAHEAQAAYWIACGLARDARALPMICDALALSTDPRQRMYAATALALVGGETASTMLRKRRTADASPLVQVAIAQALGYIGERADAPLLLDTLTHLHDPSLQSLAAVAAAFHGSSDALHGLSELARMDSGSGVRRAAAIDGFGMLLGRRPPLELSQISRSSNFTLFGDFEDDLFQVTL